METAPLTQEIRAKIKQAARLIREARYLTAFTGAGISVESGIPPFRGPGGLWSKYDPKLLELSYFRHYPEKVWPVLKKLFFESFAEAEPNEAHLVLAWLEQKGFLKALITQNIDNLHHKAGSRRVIEYHGNSRNLSCLKCGKREKAKPAIIQASLPVCSCGGILKPDFVFFGEGIPVHAAREADKAAGKTDLMLVVGTTGEVYPAALIPRKAEERGAKLIEINPTPSEFTETYTDLFIELPAGQCMPLIKKELEKT